MKILITGCGYLASIICDALSAYHEITLLSRNEENQKNMKGRFRVKTRLGDVRNREMIEALIADSDLCFHTAAMKCIENGVENSSEMLSINIDGSRIVATLCKKYDIPAYLISTDKSVQPLNLYGFTKKMAERYFLRAGLCVLRLPNVWNSTNSVLRIWQKDIEKHRTPKVCIECTRFFINPSALRGIFSFLAENIHLTGIYIPKKFFSINIKDLFDRLHPSINYERTQHQPYEKTHETIIDKDERMMDVIHLFYIPPYYVAEVEAIVWEDASSNSEKFLLKDLSALDDSV